MPLRLNPGAWIFLDGYERYGGTLGLPVREADGGGLRFITAAHVVGGLSLGRQDTNRVYTSAFGGARLASVLIGHSGQSVPAARASLCPVDAALVLPLERVECNRRIGDQVETHGGYFDDIHDEELYDLTVFKSGARTGLTRGKICEVGAELRTRRKGRQGPIRYPFGYWVMSDENQKHFALPGDSGSVVVASDGRVVGMLVAMQEASQDPSALAFVLPIRPMLEALEVTLIGPA